MEKLKVLDLFSGIGGFSLGLERTGGFETVAFCEIDPFCQKVLKKHWPDVPIYEDIRTAGIIENYDIITGGFPCQPYSTASRGRKVAECFWHFQQELIEKKPPKIFICENVQEEPIRHAEEFAKSIGYRTCVRNITASQCGAWHKRNRWWLIAHPYDESEFCRTLDAETSKLQELCSGLWSEKTYSKAIRVSNGIPRGMDGHRLKSLGNTVLPQIPEMIGYSILGVDELNRQPYPLFQS